ncbi:hypothetical protein GLOIN_2v1776609 [Rhizophagus irregularis DAOM 181602=DAOM 197198]|nr:hypothetical protein GLOIN_2v1776609 [Rhizophagus irregularis DAOM 181602=DAOM 197198]
MFLYDKFNFVIAFLSKIIAELNLWGNTIKLLVKCQHKYQTLRVKTALSSFAFFQFKKYWTSDLGDDDPRGVKSHPRTMFFEVMNTRLVSEELANGKILEHIATTIAVKILLIVKNSLMVILFNTDGQSYYNAQVQISGLGPD